MILTLIGNPGSGKTYIGKKFSKEYGLDHVDTDDLLAVSLGTGLQDFINTFGEKDFMKKEEEVILNFYPESKNLIISTGGSVIYSEKALKHLKRFSHLVYLDTSFKKIRQRVNQKERGIIGLQNKGLDEIFQERAILYEQNADYILPQELTESQIIKKLYEYSKL